MVPKSKETQEPGIAQKDTPVHPYATRSKGPMKEKEQKESARASGHQKSAKDLLEPPTNVANLSPKRSGRGRVTDGRVNKKHLEKARQARIDWLREAGSEEQETG